MTPNLKTKLSRYFRSVTAAAMLGTAGCSIEILPNVEADINSSYAAPPPSISKGPLVIPGAQAEQRAHMTAALQERVNADPALAGHVLCFDPTPYMTGHIRPSYIVDDVRRAYENIAYNFLYDDNDKEDSEVRVLAATAAASALADEIRDKLETETAKHMAKGLDEITAGEEALKEFFEGKSIISTDEAEDNPLADLPVGGSNLGKIHIVFPKPGPYAGDLVRDTEFPVYDTFIADLNDADSGTDMIASLGRAIIGNKPLTGETPLVTTRRVNAAGEIFSALMRIQDNEPRIPSKIWALAQFKELETAYTKDMQRDVALGMYEVVNEFDIDPEGFRETLKDKTPSELATMAADAARKAVWADFPAMTDPDNTDENDPEGDTRREANEDTEEAFESVVNFARDSLEPTTPPEPPAVSARSALYLMRLSDAVVQGSPAGILNPISLSLPELGTKNRDAFNEAADAYKDIHCVTPANEPDAANPAPPRNCPSGP
ncbi:MAG: hypothetical protein OXT65_10845 [Alphaproteobacteria bacterium]|nr:hypothetical protein [Alphaproteobacteria bacterium]